jgi:hypothetical protein
VRTTTFYGDPFGPLAMILCELGQIRKEATAADDSCAEVWLLGLPPKFLQFNRLPCLAMLCYMECYIEVNKYPLFVFSQWYFLLS